MSFYRTLLAAVAAVVVATPVFAEDTSATSTTPSTEQSATTNSTASSDTTSTTTSTSTEQTKVNVNTATAKDLMKVKGLNAAKARAIVAYRKKNGDFKTLDDLANVKGFKKIKPDSLKSIQEQLTLE